VRTWTSLTLQIEDMVDTQSKDLVIDERIASEPAQEFARGAVVGYFCRTEGE
jgi:hypothetical protein